MSKLDELLIELFRSLNGFGICLPLPELAMLVIIYFIKIKYTNILCHGFQSELELHVNGPLVIECKKL